MNAASEAWATVAAMCGPFIFSTEVPPAQGAGPHSLWWQRSRGIMAATTGPMTSGWQAGGFKGERRLRVGARQC